MENCHSNMVSRWILSLQQVHINEKENVVTQTIPAVHIDVIGGEVPYLDYSQRAQDISDERASRDETVGNVVKQGIISADDINEYQVIDKLQIFNFLFVFFYHISHKFHL